MRYDEADDCDLTPRSICPHKQSGKRAVASVVYIMQLASMLARQCSSLTVSFCLVNLVLRMRLVLTHRVLTATSILDLVFETQADEAALYNHLLAMAGHLTFIDGMVAMTLRQKQVGEVYAL